LDLSGNNIAGEIPSEISAYGVLRELNLASNTLEGEIPDSLYDITSLERLYLNGNPLTGTLSGQVENLQLLQVLNIGESVLEGFLPDELFSLTNLVELDIGGAGFTGQLSFGFPILAPTLRRLLVDNNSFMGTVPGSFGLLTSLNVFELQGNGFSGSIPDSICALVSDGGLQVLTADCSRVTCDCCTECF
jgi:Leucine-rich repeat (LRR) protein